jgi:hypothetical protein
MLRWTVPGTELVALTKQPSACLGDRSVRMDAGEALFNSPALLGGQAAKAGLSCASCHANGRGNGHFFMAGVSSEPGTADVTNSFFIAARGNGRFDPVVIPDLAMPGKVAREPAVQALEPFIRTLIVDEFAGQEPTPRMLAALAAYVREIKPCSPDDSRVARRLGDQLRLVDAALRGAISMARQDDPAAARSLLAAARHQLGLVAERYPAAQFPAEQRDLLAASRALQALGGAAADRDQFTTSAWAWRAMFGGDPTQRLRAAEPQSLYNPANLVFVAPQQNSR